MLCNALDNLKAESMLRPLGNKIGKPIITGVYWLLLVAFSKILEEEDALREDLASFKANIKMLPGL